MGPWIRLLRPRQWVKNLFVFAALLFSGRGVETSAIVATIGAFIAFCLLASSVYVLNDAVDAPADRAHPTKRNRPIAAGLIGIGPALAVGVFLAAGGLFIAALVHPAVARIGGGYLVLNALYTLVLKRAVLLDVFSLAAFFLLRIFAGAAAVQVEPSIWLILCGGLLSLYLGFAKRRHELLVLGDGSEAHREVLAHYSLVFLDQMSVVLLAVTLVSYIMYTVFSETAVAIGGNLLVYSSAFVLYGMFRYLYLVHQRGAGSPTETLLSDRAMLVDVTLWLAYCAWAIYRPF